MNDARAATTLTVLVVDDEPNIRRSLTICLEAEGHRVVGVTNPRDAVEEARRQSFDLALVDLRLGTESGMDLIPALLAESPWMKVVIITAYAAVDSAVEAMRRGAMDYLPKPFTPAQVAAVTRKVGEVSMDSASPAVQRATDLARQVAASDATVLIRGESGTGKGVLARAVHAWSGRADGAFVVVSCPSLSPELLESEMFGHARGAFTGAVRDNPGRLAAAEGGTLFLDEVGDLPLGLQPKLLRFLQDREYERVGETVTRRADVRVVAATNLDLEAAVLSGRFREDLLYRINVVQVDLPPLRERSEDILPLAERLAASLSRRKTILGFTDEATESLRRYTWPGNIRELRNVVERAVILCHGDRIGVEHLPANLAQRAVSPGVGDLITLDQVEEMHIRRVLATTRSLEEAAGVLGIDPATLWRRRKKYGI